MFSSVMALVVAGWLASVYSIFFGIKAESNGHNGMAWFMYGIATVLFYLATNLYSLGVAS